MCNAVFRTPFSRCPLDGTKLAELSTDPLVGTVLDKRYLIEECIGEGGMGRVYRAKHTRMSREYAIKILFGDHAGDTRMRSRFAREAEAVSRLSHTNVISVVDFGETEEGLLYLVMDLADGQSLAEIVHREAPFDPRRTVEIMARLAKGLAHAHNHGLVHRDFKCENVIMVEEEGIETPKIVDFGICMIIEDAPASTMLTSNGMIMGTPAVMAPEQASGDKVDSRTDLFSLGIVGYQMLSGCLPFEGTPLEMARKNLYEAIPSIASRSGINVDPALEAVIRKLTAKNPDERYQTAKDFLVDLQGLSMPGLFDAWTNTTPLPTPRPNTDPGMGTDNTEMVSPLGGMAPLSAAGATHTIPKRSSTMYIVAALVVLIVGGGLLYAAMNATSSSDEAEPAEVAVTDPAPAAVTYEPPTPAPAAATESDAAPVVVEDPETPDPEATLPTDEPEVEAAKGKEKNTRKGKGKGKGKKPSNTRKGKGKKPKLAKTSDAEADALYKKTIRLYHKVAKSLDALEQQRGKAAVASLRKDYNAISFSRLMRDRTMQPIYYSSLVRLNSKIVARRKKSK
jgi:serine/threonine-protein kinase